MTSDSRRPARRLRSLYLWHRYAGLAAALLAAWLAITGVLLNHADDLELSRRFVRQEWLLSLYNIQPAKRVHGLRIGTHWLAESGGRIYFDEKFIGHGSAVGATTADFGFVVAFADRLQLYTPDGVLIEELPSVTTAPITGIGNTESGTVVVAGEAHFLADADFANFVSIPRKESPPAPAREPLPEKLAQSVSIDAFHHTLTWERVLLDAHAGRVFGKAGLWLGDIAGALLLLLAASGIIVWTQRRGAQNGRR